MGISYPFPSSKLIERGECDETNSCSCHRSTFPGHLGGAGRDSRGGRAARRRRIILQYRGPGFSFFIGSGPAGRHGYGRHYGGRSYYNRPGYGGYYGRPGPYYGRPDRYYGQPYRRGYNRGYDRGYRRGYGHGPPVTRFWVPGRSTSRGYAAGYWDYRSLDRGPSGREGRAPY
jgi:hypothetical protein